MSFLGSLSQWIVQTLEPYGAPGLMIIAIGDSSFLSLPEVSDAALMALSINNPSSMWGLAVMTVIGSVIGCSLLFAVGRKGGEALLTRRFAARKVVRVRRWYDKFGMLAVIVPSLLPPPLPFKIFVLSAGAFRMPWPRFVMAVAIGRSLRYFGEGLIAVHYGKQAMRIVAENSGRFGLILASIVVLGTLIYAYARKRRQHSSMMLLPMLAATVFFSGCIVKTRTIPENKRMKDSHPFTRQQAIDRLVQFSKTIESLQTDISLSGTAPDPNDKNRETPLPSITGSLAMKRPGEIALDASFVVLAKFDMRSNGTDYEVYVQGAQKQVFTGTEADVSAKSSCKISDKAAPFINIRPRQIVETLAPDFRPLLDNKSIAISHHLLPVPKDQRTYFVLDLIDTSKAIPTTLQEVWFDLSTEKVDIVRRLMFDAKGEPDRDTVYADHAEIDGFRYPMRFDVRFVPMRTLLKIKFIEPKKMEVNEKIDAENFALGTHKNAEACRMVPSSALAQQ